MIDEPARDSSVPGGHGPRPGALPGGGAVHRIEAASVLAGSALEERVARAEALLPGTGASSLLRAALVRTLDHTLYRLADDSVFVITGDIPAMWLRDSSTQLWPYLRFLAEDPHGPLAQVVAGVLARQWALIGHDPYANAFNIEPNGASYEPGDLARDPWVWERKYEVDSLCLPIRLAGQFHRLTGRIDPFGAQFVTAARRIVATLRREQDHDESLYRFVRPGANALDTLARAGRGTPVARTGMTWSGFRPSDDACTYGYNIPANLLAAAALQDLAEIAESVPMDGQGGEERGGLAREARELSAELRQAVAEHGTATVPGFGEIYAYEVDGLGGRLLMDDANLPSLLGLPLCADVPVDDPLYQRTRAWVLSAANPYFYRGSAAAGVGSPHTWPGYVWPIALAVEGLTSTDDQRRRDLIGLLARTTAGTGFVHESFAADDPARYTREWFSWADSMVCELILDFCEGVHSLETTNR